MGDSSDRSGGQFATTRWSVVLAARDADSPASRAALSTLCEAYWYPLYAFARRQGKTAEDAQDAAQGFFTRLLEKNTLQHVHREKGRFRTFLLVSFKNYVTDEHIRLTAQKRGGKQAPLPIDLEAAEGQYRLEPAETTTPEKIFERRWAMTLLERALGRLRDEYSGPRRQRMFELLKPYLVADSGAGPYAGVARDLELTEISVRVAVHRMRRRYRAVLLDEVAQTLDEGASPDDELKVLMSAVED